MVTMLIVLAVLMLLGAIPAWQHSRNWAYGGQPDIADENVGPAAFA